MTIHVVRAGETLASIAPLYGITPRLLAGLNGLAPTQPLAVGQALALRFPRETYTVASGDTVYSIARRHGLSTRQLYENNLFLAGRADLTVGDTLVLSYEDTPLRTTAVNGYAYPAIDPARLDAALPCLTYLTPFTYGFTREGALLPTDDAALLSAAARYRAAGLLHLSTLAEDGHFSSDRAAALLTDSAAQQRLLAALLETLRVKHYYGLDVDFEYVPAALREDYAAFVTRLRDALNPQGYPVLVALAPKTSADQRGLLYEAHDYALLGAAANAVLLMTYEWGYTYGPPMAVAPLPQVRAVLDYAVTEIPAEKIFLGVPLYGYDWPLPFVQGETRAESLSPVQAVTRALACGVPILYDETAQSPHFDYTDPSGRAHTVWFEDARSAAAKLRLIDAYNLQGAGLWNITRDFPALYTVLPALYDIEVLP